MDFHWFFDMIRTEHKQWYCAATIAHESSPNKIIAAGYGKGSSKRRALEQAKVALAVDVCKLQTVCVDLTKMVKKWE